MKGNRLYYWYENKQIKQKETDMEEYTKDHDIEMLELDAIRAHESDAREYKGLLVLDRNFTCNVMLYGFGHLVDENEATIIDLPQFLKNYVAPAEIVQFVIDNSDDLFNGVIPSHMTKANEDAAMILQLDIIALDFMEISDDEILEYANEKSAFFKDLF